jgi:hypothetical protein
VAYVQKYVLKMYRIIVKPVKKYNSKMCRWADHTKGEQEQEKWKCLNTYLDKHLKDSWQSSGVCRRAI